MHHYIVNTCTSKSDAPEGEGLESELDLKAALECTKLIWIWTPGSKCTHSFMSFSLHFIP